MTQDPRLCAVGYASVDHKFLAEPFRGPGRTTLVREPLHGTAPEPGAVAYFALACARHSQRTDLITQVGTDELGDAFCEALSAGGVHRRGIRRSGRRTPSAHMFYAGDDCITFFDPGGEPEDGLSAVQTEILETADAVVIGISAEDTVRSVLDTVPDHTLLMWAVKADPASMPPDLAARLADRAQLISYSRGEADFLHGHCGLTDARLSAPDTLVVETRGRDGLGYRIAGRESSLAPRTPVPAQDQTGAGDTFAGSLLARVAARGGLQHADPHDEISGASDDVARLLTDRHTKETHD